MSALEKKELTTQDREGMMLRLRGLVCIDDIVASILIFSGLDAFSANPRIVHTVFSKIASGHPDIEQLGELQFSSGDVFPFSRLLERVLFRLEMCGLITLRNPDYDTYVIKDEVKNKMADKMRKRLEPSLLSKVTDISRSFSTEPVLRLSRL